MPDPTHPEGLEFVPHGMGFDSRDQPPLVWHLPLLLTAANIDSVRRNHHEEWVEARSALPPRVRDPRNGRLSGMSDDERDRLATLAVLIEKGLFVDDRMVVVHERVEET